MVEGCIDFFNQYDGAWGEVTNEFVEDRVVETAFGEIDDVDIKVKRAGDTFCFQ